MAGNHFERTMGTDLIWGFASAILIMVICIRLGGFSFLTPWVIAIPVVMFLAGLVRAGSPGQIIIKGIALSTFPATLLALANPSLLILLLGIPLIVTAAVLGIAARRVNGLNHS